MTVQEIALSTLEEELKQHTQRSKPLAKTFLKLMINQQDNHSLHSSYLNPLQNFFSKENTPNREEYLKEVSHSYEVGITSKKYTQGRELERLKQKIITDITLTDTEEKRSMKSDILIHKDNIKNLKDFWVVMKIKSKDKDFYSIPLEATQEAVYFDFIGRQYNNFNRLSQHDRKLTNTPNEIDLSSSVQNLYINQYAFINEIYYEEALEKFPAHKEYITNKKAIREQLAREGNKTIEEIKKDITKISFRGGREKDYQGFSLELFKETKEVTRPIIELINRIENRTAIKKHILERTTAKHNNSTYKFRTRLFFWYEYQESAIRRSMLDFVDSPTTKQVHDAIYTEEEIDKVSLKAYIKNNTGFTVNL